MTDSTAPEIELEWIESDQLVLEWLFDPIELELIDTEILLEWIARD